jgi:MSHA biogenesis protein MshM
MTLYLDHFGLKELPFSITPDTSFFFSSARYQEALNTLLIAARTGEGFIKITGEVGTGKTLLCRKFMASLGSDFVIAYIPNPDLEPEALVMSLAEELGLAVNADDAQHHLIKSLNHALMDFASAGQQVLVCIDEAQAMPLETMETLRLLTNLETEKRKLLQVVIFGQPELEEKLDHPSIRQLKQRITFDYRLGALSCDEMHYYLNHRLIVAGYQGGRLFGSGALRLLHNKTHGIPRLVNVLAHKALISVYGKGGKTVTMADVWAASQDTSATRPFGWKLWGSVFVLTLLIIGAVAMVRGGW